MNYCATTLLRNSIDNYYCKDSVNNNNNSSFISTADNPQLIQQAATQDSTDTIEHKEPVIIQPNITTRISMGGRQLQVSA